MVYFSHMMRALLVGVTLIVLTSASAAAQVRIDGDTPGLLREEERGGLAPEYCQESQASHDRLSATLEKMKTDTAYQMTIRRAQDLIRSSESDRLAADKEVQDLVLKTALSELMSFGTGLKSSKNMVDKALRRVPGKYNQAIRESAEHVKEIAMNFDKLEKSAKAGAEYGIEMQNESRDLSQDLESWKKFIKKTELSDEILSESGKLLAKSFFGPAGELAFKAAMFSIGYSVATGKGYISDSVRNQALQNLERITYARREMESKLFGLGEVIQECQLADQRDQQREDQQANLGGGGSSATVPIVIGTVAVVGAGGAYAASKIDWTNFGSTGDSGGSCGSSPAAQVNAACFPFSSGCNAAIAAMTSWCQCNGFSTFNVNTGGCQ
ncbi:MAG: hypothetical protein O7D93_12625 [Acidobacteria bacterium]|nr:hypothetical protein [Acidobacteriota bacterium]